MKTFGPTLRALTAGCCVGLAELQATAQPEPLELTVAADRPEAIYAAGEEAVFQITARREGGPVEGMVAECEITKDGVEPTEVVQLPLVDGRARLVRALDEPGFLRVRVTVDGTKATAAAGFDPWSIAPSLPAPEDFDEFWASQLARLAAVPVEAKWTPVESPQPGIVVSEVEVEALGSPVRGYLARPRHAADGSLPGLVYFHGAGVKSALPGRAARWAKDGFLVLEINAHGIPNGQPADFYDDLTRGALAGYKTRGFPDREKIYFLGMFLRAVRAADFLCAQPQWNGRTLVAYGASQGAFQALALSALDPRVTFVCAGVPAGCDHTGFAAGRVNGWPGFIPSGTPPDGAREERLAAGYYDNVAFAPRLQARGAALTVGFIDHICPPTGIFATYNAITIPKEIHREPLGGHALTKQADAFLRRAALEHAASPAGTMQEGDAASPPLDP
jgi:cephalosporin-C deacetylase-like acetyl esterase